MAFAVNPELLLVKQGALLLERNRLVEYSAPLTNRMISNDRSSFVEENMNMSRRASRWGIILVLLAAFTAPVSATVLVRMDLEKLTAGNELIVVGEVVDAYSYWNEEGSFILTDVQLIATEVLRGTVEQERITITLMGGTIGDLSTIIVGGAELEPGRSYVLFLNRESLPGVKSSLTVRDHCQGAFDLKPTAGGLRAISQAFNQPLIADQSGKSEAAGGAQGYPLEALRQSIGRTVASLQAQAAEVN